MGNQFGKLFSITTYGESHGGGIGVVIDGCPPLLPITLEEIQHDLDRRRPGQSDLTTQRDETDAVHIIAGVFEGKTLGTPISLGVRNQDAKSEDYDDLKDVLRPGHADFTTMEKYGIRDHRGGGRASARETIGRVAAGAIARKLLAHAENAEVLAWVSQVGKISADVDVGEITLETVEANPTRCPDPKAAKQIEKAIEQARDAKDSLGGVIQCRVKGIPAGLGEPVFDKLDAELAKALLSIPAAKGMEVGSGFAGAEMTGSQHNDAFKNEDGKIATETNRSGGIQGGISNGEDILVTVAFKPTSTIGIEQQTVDTSGTETTLAAKGRHDPCVLPRAVAVVEAMVCLVLADHLLRQEATKVLQ